MGNKGGTRHLKKLASSKKVKMERKDSVWTVKSRAGPHKLLDSVPLLIVVRDYLALGKNAKEAKRIIKTKEIMIDRRAVTDEKFPVGFMDIVETPKTGDIYRAVYDEKGRIALSRLKKKVDFKLVRIAKKTDIGRDKTQVTMHDGRNITVKKTDYKIGDTLKIKIPEQSIEEHFPLAENSTGYITGGKHAGETGKITKIESGTIARDAMVFFKKGDQEFSTKKDYVFVIGKEKPAIEFGEEV
ncbi:MAG: 30S ribosomal protein S4e [Candidatus Micrarchaeota archaeon]